MATVGVRELKAKASQVVQSVERGDAFLVTNRGRPVAVLLPFNLHAEDLILAEAPHFVRLRATAREEHRKGQTTEWRKLKSKAAKVRTRRSALVRKAV
jgi:prevent-host-death family protein